MKNRYRGFFNYSYDQKLNIYFHPLNYYLIKTIFNKDNFDNKCNDLQSKFLKILNI